MRYAERIFATVMTKPPFYIGHWELIPELCLYQTGAPPVFGTYSIELVEDGSLELRMSWRASADAEQQTITFGGPPDGLPQPVVAAPGAPDSFTLTHVDNYTLDSAALAAGQVVTYARRVASAEGDLLAVVQELHSRPGVTTRNFQVYRRAAS